VEEGGVSGWVEVDRGWGKGLTVEEAVGKAPKEEEDGHYCWVGVQ
jgi:hypothetical protein